MSHFSDSVASYIDQLSINRSDTVSGLLLSAVATRMGVLAFSVTSIFDSVTLLGASGVMWAGSLIAGDQKSTLQDSAAKTALSAARHFGAAFLSLISDMAAPGTVSHHFIPECSSKANELTPYGQLYHAKVDIRYPKSYEEIGEIIKEAKSTGKKITISGAGFSQGKQILPGGFETINIDLKKINRVDVRKEDKIAYVGAGATWFDVQKACDAEGLSVQTMQASNVFSVGGSIGINCHGWDIRAGALGNTIESMRVISSNGLLYNVRPGDELFEHVVGGLGQFGIILGVTLKLIENTKMVREGEVIEGSYADYFEGKIRDSSVHMMLGALSLDPKNLFGEVLAEYYTPYEARADKSTIPAELDPEGSSVDRIALGYAQRRAYVRGLGWEAKKRDLLTPKVARRNQHMFFPIQAMFNHVKSRSDWLQEYFVPKEELDDFIGFLRDVLKENDVALFNASIRYVPKDSSSALSYAKKSDQYAIVLCFSQSMAPDEIEKTSKWVSRVTDYLIDHKGTYYLPYMHFATEEQFKAAHPEWDGAAEVKMKYDPDGLFVSGFTFDYLPEALPEITRSDRFYRDLFSKKETREDLSQFFDVVFKHADKEKFFQILDSILIHARTNKEVYEELSKRFSQAQFGLLMTVSATLETLRKQIKAIGGQFDALMPKDEMIDGYVAIDDLRFIRELTHTRPLKGRVILYNPNREGAIGRTVKDIVEGGLFAPYDQVINSLTYQPIREEDVASDSVNLVTAFKGLHHISDTELSPFIESIHRILRRGGTFILREHDVTSERVRRAATFAHTVVNASDGDSFETEMKEVRHFRSVEDWVGIMKEHGFILKGEGLQRDGDPTKNTALRFEKDDDTDYTLDEVKAMAHLRKEYIGDQVGMSFQAAEWQNVLSAEQYAIFVRHSPFYEFRFIEHIQTFWKVFHKAFAHELKNHSLSDIVSSFYFWMIVFVGTTMTAEYAIKAAISSVVMSVFGASLDDRPLPIQIVIEDPENKIVEIDPRVKVLNRKGSYSIIEARQFDELTELAKKCVEHDITIHDMAGQETTQLRLDAPIGTELSGIEGLDCIAFWSNFECGTTLHQAKISLPKLSSVMKELREKGVRLEFMHSSSGTF
ncbi:MAG: FAD-binding protein [Simkaniaceae bacterium]|nr:FAD-binding protein [Simkaniaceae bacterium]